MVAFGLKELPPLVNRSLYDWVVVSRERDIGTI